MVGDNWLVGLCPSKMVMFDIFSKQYNPQLININSLLRQPIATHQLLLLTPLRPMLPNLGSMLSPLGPILKAGRQEGRQAGRQARRKEKRKGGREERRRSGYPTPNIDPIWIVPHVSNFTKHRSGQLAGDNWLVAVGGWQFVGEICWWQLVGGNFLVKIDWRQFVDGNWWVVID